MTGKIILILLALYIIFLFAPALVTYATVFCRKRSVSFLERDLSQSPFFPYQDQIAEEFAFFAALPVRDVSIQSFDNKTLRADFYDGGFPRTALCFHGYNSTGLNCFSTLGQKLYQSGWNILLINERAHGKSGGNRSTLGIFESSDVERWTQWALAQPNTKEVILAGVSMGCAAVAYASDKLNNKNIKALILDCGFTSPIQQLISDCKMRHLPWRSMMPVIWLCCRINPGIDLKTPTWKSLEHCHIPVFFIHGTNDKTVSISETRLNYQKCTAPKELLLVDGAPHAGSILFGGEKAWNALSSFLHLHTS